MNELTTSKYADIMTVMVIKDILSEIIHKHQSGDEYLWHDMLAKFAIEEKVLSEKEIVFDKQLVISVAKKLYEEHLCNKSIKKLIVDLANATRKCTKVRCISNHSIANKIYEYGMSMLPALYEKIDEEPITCIVLSGELIRLGLISNFYEEIDN